MSNHDFKTAAAAQEAGYQIARGEHGHYRGCTLLSRDTSGPNATGYSYAMIASIHADIDGNGVIDIRSEKDFATQ